MSDVVDCLELDTAASVLLAIVDDDILNAPEM